MASRRAEQVPNRPVSPRVRRNRVIASGAAALSLMVLAVAVAVAVRPDGPGRVVATRSAGPPETGASGSPGPGTTPAEPTTGGAAPRAEGGGQPVTLAFGGDVHFEGQIRARLDADPSSVLTGVAPILKKADIAVVNLETAVTTRGTRAPGKQYAFRAPASAFAALAAGGVDVASMANNHGMDYGRQGLEDSLVAAAAGTVPVIGIGRTADDAYRPFTRVVKGQRIAVIAATQVLDDDLREAWTAGDDKPGLASAKEVDRLTAAVRAAREQADTVVVYLHWGTEGASCPNEAQPDLAQVLVAAGADVIVGGHAHRLQGAGRLGSAFVAYGLGNFAFYADSGPGTETGVLTVTVTGRVVDGYRWAPARIVGQLPRPLSGSASQQALTSWQALRACTGLTE